LQILVPAEWLSGEFDAALHTVRAASAPMADIKEMARQTRAPTKVGYGE
jgi:hypothetical protein